jgi:hypothetical protein
VLPYHEMRRACFRTPGARVWAAALVLAVGGCVFDRGGVAPKEGDAAGGLSDVAPGDQLEKDGPAVDLQPTDSTLETTPLPETAPPDTFVPPDTGPGPLYQEDFTNPPGFDNDGKGTWLQQSGVYMQTSCATTEAVIPGVSWSDIAITASLRADSQCLGYSRQAGLILRVKSYGLCTADEYYVCAVDFDDDFVFICRLKNSCACNAFVKKDTGSMKSDTWYWMEFSAVGKALTCKLWGGGLSPVTINHSDNAPDALTSGTVGFVTSGVEVSFDDLTVVQK